MQKKILIVGGSSGLGKRLTEMYAAEGNQVAIIARRENLLKQIQQQFPNNIHFAATDITYSIIIENISRLIELLGGIDICIITASVIEFNHELNLSAEEKTIDINISGYLKVVNVVWHYFKQKGNGHIVGITSIAAARGNKTAPAYHASKAFQSIYLESLRVKAKSENNNIIITELIPGYIDTNMGKGDRLFWVASIDKAARKCKIAIKKKKARAFITKRWWLFYHLQRLLPIFIYDSVINASWKLKHKS